MAHREEPARRDLDASSAIAQAGEVASAMRSDTLVDEEIFEAARRWREIEQADYHGRSDHAVADAVGDQSRAAERLIELAATGLKGAVAKLSLWADHRDAIPGSQSERLLRSALDDLMRLGGHGR